VSLAKSSKDLSLSMVCFMDCMAVYLSVFICANTSVFTSSKAALASRIRLPLYGAGLSFTMFCKVDSKIA
jgi:hypothetical protein